MKAFIHGRILESEPHEICAVYDPRDGRIVHVHEVVRWPGSPAFSKHTLETRGLEIAARMGHPVSKLKALRLEPLAFDRAKRYRIDPKSARLIEIARPASLSPAGSPVAGKPVAGKPKAGRRKTAAPRSRSRKRTSR